MLKQVRRRRLVQQWADYWLDTGTEDPASGPLKCGQGVSSPNEQRQLGVTTNPAAAAQRSGDE